MVQSVRTKFSSGENGIFHYGQNNVVFKVPVSDENEKQGWYRIISQDPRIDFLMTLERFKMSSGSVMAYKEQFIEIYKAPNFSGSKMLWLRIDDVVVPSHIFIFDRQLSCKFVKEEDTTNKIQFNNDKDLVVYLYTG